MKQAIIEGIVAITVLCPDCESPGENDSGSQLIENGDRVTCPRCNQELAIPASAFRVRTPRKTSKPRQGVPQK